MTPTVIDIPASLTTLIPSAETSTAALTWLIMGFAALIALSIPVLVLSWLQTASKRLPTMPVQLPQNRDLSPFWDRLVNGRYHQKFQR